MSHRRGHKGSVSKLLIAPAGCKFFYHLHNACFICVRARLCWFFYSSQPEKLLEVHFSSPQCRRWLNSWQPDRIHGSIHSWIKPSPIDRVSEQCDASTQHPVESQRCLCLLMLHDFGSSQLLPLRKSLCFQKYCSVSRISHGNFHGKGWWTQRLWANSSWFRPGVHISRKQHLYEYFFFHILR